MDLVTPKIAQLSRQESRALGFNLEQRHYNVGIFWIAGNRRRELESELLSAIMDGLYDEEK